MKNKNKKHIQILTCITTQENNEPLTLILPIKCNPFYGFEKETFDKEIVLLLNIIKEFELNNLNKKFNLDIQKDFLDSKGKKNKRFESRPWYVFTKFYRQINLLTIDNKEIPFTNFEHIDNPWKVKNRDGYLDEESNFINIFNYYSNIFSNLNIWLEETNFVKFHVKYRAEGHYTKFSK
jgi:hypothetical protein